jgi:hypothetical protein
MACRCSELRTCDNDINLISWEIARDIRNAQDYNNNVMRGLSDIGSILLDAVFIDNASRIDQRTASLRRQQEDGVNRLQTLCSSALTRVESRQKSFNLEDERYHRQHG